MNATSLEHKLIVIKHSVTAAGHAAARPPSLLPEPPACVTRPGREAPSRPRPLSSCSARRPRPGLHKWRQARASSPRSAGSPVPGSGHRPSLQSWAGPGSHLPIRVGPPARRPGCCHRRGFRLRPEARSPRPESSGSPVMSGCPARGTAFLSTPHSVPVGTWEEAATAPGAVRRFRWAAVLAGSALLGLAPRAQLATLIAPSLLATESRAATGRFSTPVAPLRSPRLPSQVPIPVEQRPPSGSPGLASQEASGAGPGASATGEGRKHRVL